MSLINISSLVNELLCLLERTLNFMQHVGIIQGYTFSHSNIFLCPSVEKYLESLVPILEDIKGVAERLGIQIKQPKPVEVDPNACVAPDDLLSASAFIQNSEIFTAEQLIARHDFITPSGLDYVVPEIVINEPATESSWVTPESKVGSEKEEGSKLSTNAKEQFQCQVCGKSLSSKTSLHFHQATHSGQKPFCCEHCGKLFTTNVNLAAHLTRQHNLNTESAYSCSECGKLFVRKSALDTHLKSHLGIKPWVCQLCDKSFTQKVTRDTHQLTHSRDYKFCCDDCGKTFPTRAKLNCHTKTHREPQYTCHICDKKFALKQYLTAHCRMIHDLGTTKTAPCRLDTVSSQVVEGEMNIRSLSCGLCNQSFHTQYKLAVHTHWHKVMAVRYRNAEKCKKSSHTCVECGKEFMQRSSLEHHRRQKHTSGLTERQLRPYSCQLCHKRFTLRAKARLHMRIHTQEEKYNCSVCSRGFLRKDSLRRHMNCHRAALKEPSHKYHKCSQCDKSFSTKSALGFHLQSHKGTFRFQCDQCGKQFVRKCHYRDHLTTHSSQRPYTCDICGKGFKNTKNCWEHTRRVHATQPAPPAAVGDQLSSNAITINQMAIQTLLAGDDATYGQTYDQFQACVQLQ